ncbi:hypothetical protein M3G18_11300 [Corynebacterium sp. p3-SID1145]|uniref:hypothetical protein n=1 Tax=unclassified Corynebacterium TaxID=2624378 RepID=UPI0021A9FD71|nr:MULTISPECIES: hypothetical protein [unclassified Corynebacterium]MCT1453466.1 hypothetical protein [Corynebacterium sp. p3-SID1145]MCT1462577.1 hypothetical protein [Corynebacterium sp. p3-SID1140]
MATLAGSAEMPQFCQSAPAYLVNPDCIATEDEPEHSEERAEAHRDEQHPDARLTGLVSHRQHREAGRKSAGYSDGRRHDSRQPRPAEARAQPPEQQGRRTARHHLPDGVIPARARRPREPRAERCEPGQKGEGPHGKRRKPADSGRRTAPGARLVALVQPDEPPGDRAGHDDE